MITEYQYFFVATSAYLGIMEAVARGEKVPNETVEEARKLFQSAYVRAGLRFKNIPAPHYTGEELDEMFTRLHLKKEKEDVGE